MVYIKILNSTVKHDEDMTKSYLERDLKPIDIIKAPDIAY